MPKINFEPLLSVLIATVSERSEQANALFNRLEMQAEPHPVEILMLRDNRRSGIGEARNRLLRASSGKYVTFCDDDDDYADDYFASILPSLSQQADVITYNQRADVDGEIAGGEGIALRQRHVRPGFLGHAFGSRPRGTEGRPERFQRRRRRRRIGRPGVARRHTGEKRRNEREQDPTEAGATHLFFSQHSRSRIG